MPQLPRAIEMFRIFTVLGRQPSFLPNTNICHHVKKYIFLCFSLSRFHVYFPLFEMNAYQQVWQHLLVTEEFLSSGASLHFPAVKDTVQ